MNILKKILTLLVISLFTLSSTKISKAEELPVAKIAHLPITDHLILGVAKERSGANFKNLTLETIKFSDYASLIESLRSESLTGAIMLAPLAFQLKAKGADLNLVLLGHRDGSALVVRVKEEIKSVNDLKGKLIAIPSRFSTNNMLLHMYVTQAGLDYAKDIRVIEMPPPEMPSALAQGTIDGFITAEPLVSKSELSGTGRVLIFSGQIWKHHPDCVLVLNSKWLKKYPAAAQELIEAMMAAGNFIESNRVEGAKAAARFFGFSEDIMMHALNDPLVERVTFRNLVPVIEELDKLQSYLANEMKLIKDPIDMEKFVDKTFALTAEAHLKSLAK